MKSGRPEKSEFTGWIRSSPLAEVAEAVEGTDVAQGAGEAAGPSGEAVDAVEDEANGANEADKAEGAGAADNQCPPKLGEPGKAPASLWAVSAKPA